jgi:hypothetical protein
VIYYLCSYSLLIVHLFCSLFDYLFCFHFSLIPYLFIVQKKKSNSDPELCSGISILLPVKTEEVPVVQHHHLESINIIQQTPPTLS